MRGGRQKLLEPKIMREGPCPPSPSWGKMFAHLPVMFAFVLSMSIFQFRHFHVELSSRILWDVFRRKLTNAQLVKSTKKVDRSKTLRKRL